MTADELLTRIDTYYDTAPRATARAEEFGPLVLFVAERGWPFYARPRLERDTEPTADDIRVVLARQGAIRVAFATPGTAVAQAGCAERDTAATSSDAARRLKFTVDGLRESRTVQVGAFVRDAGFVGGGSHIPRVRPARS